MRETASRPHVHAGRAAASSAAALAVAGAVLSAGCGGAPPAPVGRLAVSPSEVTLGYPRSAALAARWEMTGELSAASTAPDVRVFVHLLDGSGSIVRTFDHPLGLAWRPGETHESSIELWQSALAQPLTPGTYRLTVGLYGAADGRRWRLETTAPEVDGGEYEVARVRVPAAGAGAEVAFTGSWWPAEEGGDRQVLARRWLDQDGRVVLTGLAGAVRLELGLRIPEPAEGERRVLREGAEGVRLRVSSPCATGDAVVEGAGDHRVALDLRPAAGGRCTVRLEPSFVVVDLSSLARRSAALERLTLDPAAGR